MFRFLFKRFLNHNKQVQLVFNAPQVHVFDCGRNLKRTDADMGNMQTPLKGPRPEMEPMTFLQCESSAVKFQKHAQIDYLRMNV